MSDQSDEHRTGISDEDLPEDLQPSDDNPLAKPLSEEDDPKSPEELDVLEGKTPVESADDADDGTDAAGETDDTQR